MRRIVPIRHGNLDPRPDHRIIAGFPVGNQEQHGRDSSG